MAVSDAGEVLGVGRVHFNNEHQAQIRYMAVDERARGQGTGSQLLAQLESIARRRGALTMVLDAREAAVGFYTRHGYAISGEGHTLFGEIRHKKMRKQL